MNVQANNQKKVRLVSGRESITNVLAEMQVGDTVSFPPTKFGSVRTIAWSYGFSQGRKYTVKANHEKGIVEVTRTI